MSAMITTQHKYRKLDKIGPNTLKVVPTPTTTTEKKSRTTSLFLTQSVYQ